MLETTNFSKDGYLYAFMDALGILVTAKQQQAGDAWSARAKAEAKERGQLVLPVPLAEVIGDGNAIRKVSRVLMRNIN